ncbi:C40 family peptidase [Luteimonas sp. A478]
MTIEDPSQGRQAATRTSASRLRQRAATLLFSALLCAGAAPAFAATGLATDSADGFPISTSISQQLSDPLPAASRELLFAADVNQLITTAADLQIDLAPAPQTAVRQSLLQRGLALLGTPYRWGGTSPERGFDCSGLVSYVFKTTLGIDLPRVSRDMARAGAPVERAQLDPGDLVFFALRGGRIDHVGIYIGEGRFLHAPRTGRDVTVSALDGGYWAGKFKQARRIATH